MREDMKNMIAKLLDKVDDRTLSYVQYILLKEYCRNGKQEAKE